MVDRIWNLILSGNYLPTRWVDKIGEIEMSDMQDFLGGATAVETNVDIVFVIDATKSMDPIIEMVKDSTMHFHEELTKVLEASGKRVNKLRVKVNWFRDFYFDGDQAYGESEFFNLPGDEEAFRDFVSSIEAKGGGDDPETSLEALTLAMRTNWVQDGTKKRHIIVLFTDASAHPFEDYDELKAKAEAKGCKVTSYPENMPKSLDEFFNDWVCIDSQESLGSCNMSPTGRRLIIYAPDSYPCSDLTATLNYVQIENIEQQSGGDSIEMGEVMSQIAFSMS